MHKRVLFLDEVHPILDERLKSAGMEVIHDHVRSLEEMKSDLPSFQGLVIRSRIPINKAFLQECKNLEFICRSGAGLENIDTDYCADRGIALLHAPEGNQDAVAEHALGMILTLFNKLNLGDPEIRKGQWKREANRGIELKGKTVGIIGYGHMGRSFAQRLQGFDVRVLALDPAMDQPRHAHAERVDMDTLFQETDVLSLHVPLTDSTRSMVNESFINSFKKPFYLINTARGPVVETSALVKGLNTGKVLGACLDVLEYETSSFENLFANQDVPEDFQALLNDNRVVFSPHVAGWTVESYRKLSEVLADKVYAHYDFHRKD